MKHHSFSLQDRILLKDRTRIYFRRVKVLINTVMNNRYILMMVSGSDNLPFDKMADGNNVIPFDIARQV